MHFNDPHDFSSGLSHDLTSHELLNIKEEILLLRKIRANRLKLIREALRNDFVILRISALVLLADSRRKLLPSYLETSNSDRLATKRLKLAVSLNSRTIESLAKELRSLNLEDNSNKSVKRETLKLKISKLILECSPRLDIVLEAIGLLEDHLELLDKPGKRNSDYILRKTSCTEEMLTANVSSIMKLRDVYLGHQNFLASRNLRLVLKISQKFKWSEVPFDDLVQEGMIGLIRAINKFDIKRGIRFSTYATWWVKQSINRSISESHYIRRTATIIQKSKYLHEVERGLIQTLGYEPSTKELSDSSGMSVSDIESIKSITSRMISIEDRRQGLEKGAPIKETLETPSLLDGDLLEKDHNQSNYVKIMSILNTHLNSKQKEVMVLRFGLGGNKLRTFSEISGVIGVTKQRVHQIYHEAIELLSTEEVLNEFREFFQG